MSPILQGAYVARLDLTEQHLAGVAAKIRGQISALEAMPARIRLYHPAGASILADGQHWGSYEGSRFSKRWNYYFRFYPALARRLASLDFVYIRYQGCSPFLLWMLRELRRKLPGIVIVTELPSYPYHTEARSLRERLFVLVDRLTRSQLHRYVDRIVTFSKEERIFGIETIQTDNGVDVANIELLPKPSSTRTLHLLGLANLSFWHGYDRVIAGLAAYRSNGGEREIHFDVVGTGTELGRLKSLASDLGVADQVTFWGARHGKELDEIISHAHVGISSIGMHRLNVDTSNIKSREFCARGLPFVIGYPDRDFDASLPFVMHVAPDESAIDIATLMAFYHRLSAMQGDFRTMMREYANRHLTWSAKMRAVTTSIRSLLPGNA